MKLSLFILPLFFMLQLDTCSSDDSSDGPVNNSFITFSGETNEAFGGCNVQSQNNPIFCTYVGSTTLANGNTIGISFSHSGICRTATFNFSDVLDDGDAVVIVQIATDGVVTDTYIGLSGIVDLGDFGATSNMDFSGDVIHSETGEIESISGFIECL